MSLPLKRSKARIYRRQNDKPNHLLVKVRDGVLKFNYGQPQSFLNLIGIDGKYHQINTTFWGEPGQIQNRCFFPNSTGYSCAANQTDNVVYCTGGKTLVGGFEEYDSGYYKIQLQSDGVWTYQCMQFPMSNSPPLNDQFKRTDHISIIRNNEVVVLGGSPLQSYVGLNVLNASIRPLSSPNMSENKGLNPMCVFTISNSTIVIGSQYSNSTLSVFNLTESNSGPNTILVPTQINVRNQAPPARNNINCVSNGKSAMVFGGCSNSRHQLSFEDNIWKWTALPDFPDAPCRSAASMLTAERFIISNPSLPPDSNFRTFDLNTTTTPLNDVKLEAPKPTSSTTSTSDNSINAKTSSADDSATTLPIIIGSIVGGVVLIIIIIVGVIIWRRRKIQPIKSKNDDESRRLLSSQERSGMFPPFTTSAPGLNQTRDVTVDERSLSDIDVALPMQKLKKPSTVLARVASLPPNQSKSRNVPLIEVREPSEPEIVVPMPDLNSFKADSTTLYTVQYEHEPEIDDELALNPGDKLVIIKIYGDGWAKGICNGRTGAFPLTHLLPI
ncbi:hypothetical protein HK098_001055 [Nowakowskiella sp. JEL0407]|nr:hypothetical protein HK098_001055 [Nowakowskiella sp. JEL0407]